MYSVDFDRESINTIFALEIQIYEKNTFFKPVFKPLSI